MGRFLVLFWCAAVARAVLRYNSRFAVLNSRLGLNKFPFSRQRELPGKGLICLALFGAETALFGHNRENSRFHGNNREFRPRARLAMAQPAAAPLFLFLDARVRFDHLTSAIFGRLENCLGPRIPELLEIGALDVLELDLQDPRLRPLAVLAEADLADDRVEWVAADVVGELCLVEALRYLDRFPQNLKVGIGEGRQVPPQRVDPFARRLGLVGFEELRDARKLHGRRWDPKVVVDDAVELRPELLLHRGVLQADHAAPEIPGLETNFGGGAHH